VAFPRRTAAAELESSGAASQHRMAVAL